MTTEEVPDSWRRSFTTKEERAVALLIDRECCLKSLASDESSSTFNKSHLQKQRNMNDSLIT